MPQVAQEERLFRLAVERAEEPFGKTGLAALGGVLRRALIMSEVAYIIAGQDSEGAGPAMIRLAQHAAMRLQ